MFRPSLRCSMEGEGRRLAKIETPHRGPRKQDDGTLCAGRSRPPQPMVSSAGRIDCLADHALGGRQTARPTKVVPLVAALRTPPPGPAQVAVSCAAVAWARLRDCCCTRAIHRSNGPKITRQTALNQAIFVSG